ncbi:MAG: type II and III secretion system protein, partial [Desulfobacterales bacterium]|nr:type II and III secretion system protein [Desulfobacterales bacterium]
MKIVVESSDIGLSTTIGQGSYPSFTTRRATTSAVVEDAHTLFLGGLISEKKSNSSDGIPFLSRIPIIGLLFGSHNK